jgi:hypothetical protein
MITLAAGLPAAGSRLLLMSAIGGDGGLELLAYDTRLATLGT